MALRTRLTLLPGRRGTKALVEQYGERLVCVRYRYDAARGVRLKTVELIIEERAWRPRPKPEELVFVRVGGGEYELQRSLRKAGGEWRRDRRLWQVQYKRVVELGLQERIVYE